MESFGKQIKFLRKQAKLPLRTVAGYLDIDQAILSKIENGKRNATKNQVKQLANYFGTNEKELMINYLSDKIVNEIKYEPLNQEILMAAEEKIACGNSLALNQENLIPKLKDFFKNESKVVAAYLFGSMARKQANDKSDIDLMVELSKKEKHTMFDLLDIQYRLQKLFNKKVDLVEKGYVKSHAKHLVEKDMKLIIKK